MREPVTPRVTWAAWALALSAFAGCIYLAHRGAVAEPMRDDSRTFLCAVRLALSGGNPYDHAQLSSTCTAWTHANPIVQPYFYPPPFLAFSAWTAVFPDYPSAQAAWTIVNALTVLALAWRLSVWSGLSLPACIGGTCAYYPTIFNQQVGNVNAALTIVLLEAVMRMSGSWLAIGVAAKISPVVVLAAMVGRREGRALVAFALTTAALVATTVALYSRAPFEAFHADVWPVLASGTYPFDVPRLDGQLNHAFSRVLVLLGDDPSRTHLSPLANGIRSALMLGMSGLLAMRARTEPTGGLGMLGVAGAFGCVMVLCAPLAWDTHLMLVLPALAFAFTALPPGRRAGLWIAGLSGVLALPFDWWQPVTYLFPDLAAPLGAMKMVAVFVLYCICLVPRPAAALEPP